jgi:hypothetical protein
MRAGGAADDAVEGRPDLVLVLGGVVADLAFVENLLAGGSILR